MLQVAFCHLDRHKAGGTKERGTRKLTFDVELASRTKCDQKAAGTANRRHFQRKKLSPCRNLNPNYPILLLRSRTGD